MTEQQLIKHLALRIICKDSCTVPFNMLKNFGFDIDRLFRATPSDFEGMRISKDKISALETPPIKEASELLQYCRDHRITLLTYTDPKYPKRLRNIYNPPFMLFVKGELPDFDTTLSISIVGTRHASEYGIKAADFFAYQLAKSGAVIISGGAMGIDTQAHAAALEAGGKTVAVIGCGIGYDYPTQNRNLREQISQNGAIVSEYIPSERPSNYHFPIRNRIISALSQGTLVVEAGIKSGALITADLALEQGNDIFALPGSILESSFEGTNKLIKEGAKPVFSALDILEEYTRRFGDTLNLEGASLTIGDMYSSSARKQKIFVPETHTRKTPVKRVKKQENEPRFEVVKSVFSQPVTDENKDFTLPPLPEGLSEDASAVYKSFTQKEMSFDTIAESVDLSPAVILSAISELELFGLVSKGLGNNYIVNN